MTHKKRSLKYIIVLIIILVVLAFLLRTAVMKKLKAREETASHQLRPVAVETIFASRRSLESTLSVVVWIEPGAKAVFSPKVPVYVKSVEVEEGRAVKKGEILASLDTRDLEQRIRSLEAQIRETESRKKGAFARISALNSTVSYLKKESRRDSMLADQGAIPLSSAEASATKYQEAKGNLEDAENNAQALNHLMSNLEEQKKSVMAEMDYRIFKAPYEGIVTAVNVDPGDLASPGSSVIVVEKNDNKVAAFSVPQEDASLLQSGREVIFSWEGQQYNAVISNIYPSADQNRMVKVDALIENRSKSYSDLPSGMSFPARVILQKTEEAVTVPLSAIFSSEEGKAFVYRVVTVPGQKDEAEKDAVPEEHQVLEAVSVSILHENAEKAAVEGLASGDRIVTSSYKGSILLNHGLRVISR